MALQWAPTQMKGEKKVVLAAVQRDGYALWYAAEELRSDSE